jgi:DNA-binding transcriptional regulator YiaG
MSTFASSLKHEIVRLARREIRQATAATRKAATASRHDIAALKRMVAELERQTAILGKAAAAQAKTISAKAPEGALRFVAKGFRAHRARLGLSAPQVAALLGTSSQSVYNWENGIASPRKDLLGKIAVFRRMGKREAQRRLNEPKNEMA